MKKEKIIKTIIVYLLLSIILLIQFIDKDGSYRTLQYSILVFMALFVIYEKLIKKKN